MCLSGQAPWWRRFALQNSIAQVGLLAIAGLVDRGLRYFYLGYSSFVTLPMQQIIVATDVATSN